MPKSFPSRNSARLSSSSPGVEGLCHVSELSDSYVKSVDAVCKMGDLIPVKLLLVDDQGRFKLSRKAALAELGLSDKKDQPKKK